MELTLTQADLDRIVASRIDALLTEDRVEQLAQAWLERRVGLLTLKEAQRLLRCRNERQLLDFCRQQKIPLEAFSTKKRFVRLSEIEAALKRVQRDAADPAAIAGTKIARVAVAPKRLVQADLIAAAA